MTAEEISTMEEEIKREVESAAEYALSSPEPDPKDIEEKVVLRTNLIVRKSCGANLTKSECSQGKKRE